MTSWAWPILPLMVQPTPTSAREPLYDYARVIAIVAVIGIHALAPWAKAAQSAGTAVGPLWLFDQAIFFAVPLFLFVSGALVWAKREPMGAAGYRAFLARRAVVVGVPYLLWSAIYLAVRPLAGVAPAPTSLWNAVVQYVAGVVSGTTFYHLYFIPMLFVLYALTPLAIAVGRRSPEALLVGVVLVRAVLGPLIMQAVGMVPPLRIVDEVIEDAIIRMPYMALGAWFAYRADIVRPQLRRVWPAVLALGLATFPTKAYGELRAISVVLLRVGEVAAAAAMLLGLTGLADVIAGRNRQRDALVHRLAALSFGVYLAHALVMWFLRDQLGAAGVATERPLVSAGIFVVTTVVTTALVWGLKRWKVTARLV